MSFPWTPELDALILENRKIECLERMAEICPTDLGDRIRAMTKRYDQLRVSRPGEFTCSHDEYWEGFLS